MKWTKKRLHSSIEAVCLFLLSTTSGQAFAESNLLMNGSFEGAGAWNYSDTSHGYTQRSNVRSLGGEYSLHLFDSSTSGGVGAGSREIPVKPGVKYLTQAQLFRESGHPPHLYVKYYDQTGAVVSSFSASPSTSLNVWSSVALTTTAPATAVKARILPHFISNRTGSAYYDNIEFRRAPEQSLVNNEDFEVDAIGAGYPVNWWKWTTNSESVYVALDPFDSGNKVLKIVDSSSTISGNAKTYFELDGGLNYKISARVLPESGSTPAGVYIKFYDSDGTEIFSRSKFPDSVSGSWETVSFSVRAPAQAVKGAILAYCGVTATCTSYFDEMRVTELWSTTNTRYVSPDGTSTTGLTETDPARYNDATFWSSVESSLDSFPMRVVFLPAEYPITSTSDRLQLYDCGHNDHRLVLESENVYGTEFILSGNSSGAPILRFNGCNNVSIRNFRFSSDTSQGTDVMAGDGVHIHAGSEPSRGNFMKIDGMSLVGIPNIKYGGIKLYGPLNSPSVKNSELIRAGSGAGYHHIYAAGNAVGGSTSLRVSNSYFEDSSGVYVDIRKNHYDAAIVDSAFFSSGEYINGHYVFLGLYVINDVDPGDEWFGKGYVISGNEFRYAYTGSDAIRFVHKGYNPLDENGVTRRHLLNETEQTMMFDESTNNISNRQQIMHSNFHLPVGDKTNGVCIANNVYTNTNRNIGLWTAEMFGSGETDTTSGMYDISNLFNSATCN